MNPNTFAVVRRIGIGQLLTAHSGPTLDVAYVFSRVSSLGMQTNLPFLVNLNDGSVAAMTVEGGLTAARQLGSVNLNDAVVSPDGKWLIAENRKLLRYRINGTILSFAERTHEELGAGENRGICISSDGQWVCCPYGAGIRGIGRATHVYRTVDLSRPAFLLRFEEYTHLIGFDPVGKRLFSQNDRSSLLLFDQNGTKRGDYKLPVLQPGTEVRQYVAHPANRRSVLVRTKDALTLVEIATPE